MGRGENGNARKPSAPQTEARKERRDCAARGSAERRSESSDREQKRPGLLRAGRVSRLIGHFRTSRITSRMLLIYACRQANEDHDAARTARPEATRRYRRQCSKGCFTYFSLAFPTNCFQFPFIRSLFTGQNPVLLNTAFVGFGFTLSSASRRLPVSALLLTHSQRQARSHRHIRPTSTARTAILHSIYATATRKCRRTHCNPSDPALLHR